MSEEIRKDVHNLTNEELRREIAEALGWRVHVSEATAKTRRLYKVIAPGHSEDEPTGPNNVWWSAEAAWQSPAIPDWPNSIDAVFWLLLSIAEREQLRFVYDVRSSPWRFEFRRLGFGTVHAVPVDDRIVQLGYARALSELAALALRQMGDPALTGKRD